MTRSRAAARGVLVADSTDEVDSVGFDDLVDLVGAPASMRWAHVASWLREAPDVEQLVVQVFRDERLVGAAALTVRRQRLLMSVEKAGTPGEPFSLLHADRAAAAELGEAVVAALGELGPWRMWLTDLVGPDQVAQHLHEHLSHSRWHDTVGAPTLDVGPDRPALPSRNTRQAAAKARNRIAREGHVLDVEWTADPTEVAEALPELVSLHVRRNEQIGRQALLREPWQRAYFEAVVHSHAAAGRLDLLQIRIDRELAAFAICLRSEDSWWVWSNYADPDWLHFSPGTVCNAEVVRTARADPSLLTIDWGAGSQRYKMSGGAQVAPRTSLSADSSLALAALRRGGRGLASVRRALRELR